MFSKQEETFTGSCEPLGLSSPVAETPSICLEETPVAFVWLGWKQSQPLWISSAPLEKETSQRVDVQGSQAQETVSEVPDPSSTLSWGLSELGWEGSWEVRGEWHKESGLCHHGRALQTGTPRSVWRRPVWPSPEPQIPSLKNGSDWSSPAS